MGIIWVDVLILGRILGASSWGVGGNMRGRGVSGK